MRKFITTTVSSILAAGLCTGLASAQTFTPPAAATSTQSTVFTDTYNMQINALSVDPNGNIYFVRPNTDNAGDGNFYERLAASNTEIALIGGNTLSYPKGVASDANYGYVSDFHGHLWRVPNGGGTAVDILPACNALDAYYLGTQAVAADGNGNVYVAGQNESGLFKITAAGVCTAIPNVTTDANSRIAVDAAGDISYSLNQKTLYSLPSNATTPVVTGTFSAINGLRADAFGNVFVTTGSAVVEVPFVSGTLSAASEFTVLPSSSSSDVGIGSTGTVYTTDSTNVFLNTVGNMRFASATVGAAAATQVVTVVFNSTQTLTGIRFTAGTGTSSDITNTGAGTCAIGQTYSAATTCTLTLAATPVTIGTRNEAVLLSSAAGVIGSVAVAVQGSGAGLVADPGTQTSLGSGFTAPDGVAVGASGSVLIADKTAGTLSYIAAGTTTSTVIATGLTSPSGVAIAGDGTAYVANTGANTVVRVPFTTTGYGAAAVAVSGLNAPSALAIAPTGDLYIANTGAGTLLRVPNQSGVLNTIDKGGVGTFTKPNGLVFDRAGTLYVADSSAGIIYKITSGIMSTAVSGLASPGALAIDDSETLYVLQTGSKTVLRIPFTSGAFSTNSTTALGAGLTTPAALAADSAGNLYVADAGAPGVVRIQRTAGALPFGNVNVGATSAAQSLVFSNDGDTTLTFGSPLYTAAGNTADFTVGTTGSTCAAAATVASGATCSLSATFTPAMSGARSDVLTIASNAANASPITATLAGTGVNLAKTTLTLAQSPTGSITFGSSVMVTATITPAAGSNGTPGGTVQFSVNGVAYGLPVTLANSMASVTISGLAAGNNTVSATYSGDMTFASSTNATALLIVVTLAPTNTTLTANVGTTPVPAGTTSITFTATVTSAVTSSKPSGTVTFTEGGVTLGMGTVNTATGVASITSTAFPVGTYSVVATYNGDTGFAVSVSNSVTIANLNPTYLLSNTPTALSVSAPGSVGTAFTVTPISGYTGGVDMSCSGLPANTQCTFTPAAIYFINTVNSTGGAVAAGPQTIGLTITTDTPPRSTVAAWILPFGGLLLLGAWRSRRKLNTSRIALCLFGIAALTGMLSLNGCSSANNSLTPLGTSTVTVNFVGTPSGGTGSSPTTNMSKSFTFTLTVH